MPTQTDNGAARPGGSPPPYTELDKARAALQVARARTNAMLDQAVTAAGDDPILTAIARHAELTVHAFRELALDLRVLTLEPDPPGQP